MKMKFWWYLDGVMLTIENFSSKRMLKAKNGDFYNFRVNNKTLRFYKWLEYKSVYYQDKCFSKRIDIIHKKYGIQQNQSIY